MEAKTRKTNIIITRAPVNNQTGRNTINDIALTLLASQIDIIVIIQLVLIFFE